mmetsp:Transcript_15935/g.18153  ORF Transcript_15935/g.18153 Transcript_15935/m.18153 type:complete len:292 (-) Transcript_15935:59-934(-)
MSSWSTAALSYLSGSFPYAEEYQAFFMALQGVMKVRAGPNKNSKMHWFHAFLQGVVLAYAGGLFTPLWMGRPTSLLANDVNIGSCILAYILINCVPLNLGYKVADKFPIRLLTVMGAQLFRSMGIMKFVNIAYEAFKDSPSKYYPTPVFGPILNAAILGNMGSFFALGFDGHLKNGMPLPFQNSLFLASFYHFIVNDKDGPIGEFLRTIINGFKFGLDDKLFAVLFVNFFMQTWAILQMPDFLGPTFNPFNYVLSLTERRGVKKKAMQSNKTVSPSLKNNSKKKKKKKKTN